jgi:hypothetical protein
MATDNAEDFKQGAKIDEAHCLAAGEADTVYDEATKNYQGIVSREVNRGLFARISRKLGVCTTFKPTGTFVNSSNRGTYVTTSYRSSCEKGGLDESFIWSIESGKAKLWKYSIASPLLSSLIRRGPLRSSDLAHLRC